MYFSIIDENSKKACFFGLGFTLIILNTPRPLKGREMTESVRIKWSIALNDSFRILSTTSLEYLRLVSSLIAE
ncbi:hypothetical protein BpHYR1_025059 [Brachionus plicatilis]|uniref:Uncharacterized protein n=1 Tax=Brachionus plicatilis TaxID=10195 RepID=A0A3M7SEA5_BRAPC|nr:hypothetical protein BpHYR1_025059 [Brachionus plicatilis]